MIVRNQKAKIVKSCDLPKAPIIKKAIEPNIKIKYSFISIRI